MGIAPATFYNGWPNTGGGCVRYAETKKGRGAFPPQEDVRGPSLGKPYAQGCTLNKVVKPSERKNMAVYLMESYSISTTRACRVTRLPKSIFYYQLVKNDQPVIDKLLELAQKHIREGLDKMYERIRSQGQAWNYKRQAKIDGSLTQSIRHTSAQQYDLVCGIHARYSD